MLTVAKVARRLEVPPTPAEARALASVWTELDPDSTAAQRIRARQHEIARRLHGTEE